MQEKSERVRMNEALLRNVVSRKTCFATKIKTSAKKTNVAFWTVRQEQAVRLASNYYDTFNTQEVQEDERLEYQTSEDYIKPVAGLPVYDENEKYW